MTVDTLALDDFGTAPLTDMFTVFVDRPGTGRGGKVEFWRTSSRYNASALAHHALDLGYDVETDLWSDDGMRYAPIPDAMISPAVWEGYRLDTLPSADYRPLLACSDCQDARPDAVQVGQGVSKGASCVFYDCDGTYTDPR